MIDSLDDCTNDELDELAALAQGWEKFVDEDGDVLWIVDNGDVFTSLIIMDYSPTSNGQHAWDLMVKYKQPPIPLADGTWYNNGERTRYSHDDGLYDARWATIPTNPLRSVTIGAIKAAHQ